ncbi:MAG: hypothetical protein GY694_12360 [Gammaproteobacteria bacterium]|nr:hypothetical protein [Gammaproteobacteria bacterium]
MTSEAQKLANQRQDKKRAGMARIEIRLTEKENELFQQALKKSGQSKKGMVIEALKKYIDS